MGAHKLTAEPRKMTGRKVRRLRGEGKLPANVFGKDVKSYAITVPSDEFKKVFDEAGETGIIELTVGKKKSPVLVSNVQVHPVSGGTLHVDFRQIDLTKKITATVPVEVVGESPAEKSGLGTVVQQISELEVEALPADLPESFSVDVNGLTEVDDAIYVRDLDYDKDKVKVEAEGDQIVVKVEPPQKEEEVAPPPAEEGEEAVALGEETPSAEGEVAEEAPVEEEK